jgi:hypothetical protein
VKTLTKDVDLARTDRRTPSFLSVMIKGVGALWAASFVAGITGDLWLASMILVGYPAAWSVAWLISK